MSRGIPVSCVALGGVLTACGPSVNDGPANQGEVDAAPTDVPQPDAPPASPLPDAATQTYPMYAHSRDTLFTVTPGTFAITIVGTFDVDDLITDLAVTSEGLLYGISTTKLYRISPSTGKASLVSPVSGRTNVGMTFLRDGELLATDKEGGVRRINPTTGAVTEIGGFGGGFATAGDLVAVADDTMYAISDEGPVGDELENNWLLTVNPDNGQATPVGQIGFARVYGCAFADGHVYAFTQDGKIIEIDPVTGRGSMIKEQPVEFWGAGVSPLVPPIP